ncbi:oxidoreductase [Actinomadura sp. WMMB 499]|uniref:oxidoreductase n=1 Tax=Actinomadura sp. WMMB 499 TaxID=1219491 RepID=UPI001247B9CD|nr:oxidoreductase [Actinomadura sp. WMMB 499]QFG24500.1 SDR family NAD(P)-dependent oxidoreductase [Actinomadura sp. WMMB 499]
MPEWSPTGMPALDGRTAVVTGANTGIGRAVAEALARRGARVVMACRDRAKAEAARRAMLDGTGLDPDRLAVRHLDLGDLSGVARFAGEFLGAADRLDLLVNNAGLAFVDRSRTADGFETHFGVNHLGHLALTLRLLPALVATPHSRVVTVTSVGHRLGRIRLADPCFAEGGYGRTRAYTQSKLANVLFTAELARRLDGAGHGTRALSADPGGARTELGTKQNGGVMRAVAPLSRLVPSQPPAGGALPILRAATDPAARNGDLYAPRRGMRGEPARREPGARARDREMAELLWHLSLEMTGLEEPAELAPTRTR